jgi:predicted dinucleotide-binding enzyme
VPALVDGFGPVDVGGLDESWRHQPERPVLTFTAAVDADGARAAL